MEPADLKDVPLWLFDLPALNATLNACCAVFLVLGWIFIRKGRKRAHIVSMITALTLSALFLSSYLTYHFGLQHFAGGASIRFTHPGLVRTFYLTLLLTHVLLAIINLPLIILTVVPALRGRFDRHKRIARWTLPSWLYVSVTGVIVYFMLYQWFPPEILQHIPRR